jgi:hypothetical protein
MTNPNSWLARRRFALVRILEPKPPDGQAWCVECGLYEYRTFIMPIDDVQNHTEAHVLAGNGRVLRIMFNRPPAEE